MESVGGGGGLLCFVRSCPHSTEASALGGRESSCRAESRVVADLPTARPERRASSERRRRAALLCCEVLRARAATESGVPVMWRSAPWTDGGLFFGNRACGFLVHESNARRTILSEPSERSSCICIHSRVDTPQCQAKARAQCFANGTVVKSCYAVLPARAMFWLTSDTHMPQMERHKQSSKKLGPGVLSSAMLVPGHHVTVMHRSASPGDLPHGCSCLHVEGGRFAIP